MGDKPTDPASLRAEAEARVVRRNIMLVNPQPGEALLHELMHELKVHQIELEMQNEELRRTQLALEESRDRYVDLYEFAPVGYLTLNRDGMIDEVNLTCASLLGVERKSLLKRRFAHLVAIEDRDRWHRYSLLGHQNEGKQSCELTILRPEGTRFHAQLDFESREAGEEPVLRITLADITERKWIETELYEAKRLAEATNSLTANIAILDEAGTIIAVNRAWRTFAEANSASLAVNVCEGSNYLATCDQADGADSEEAAAVAAGIRAVMRGELEKFELEYPCHSPVEQRWFIVRVTQLSGEGLARVVVSHENITTRKQAENLLKQSEQRYQGMLEVQSEIISRFKADGTVLYVNEAWCRLYGKHSEELVGQKWHPVVVQEDLALIQEKLNTLSPNHPEVTIENRIVIHDGSIRWAQFVNRAFYDGQGNLTEIQSVGRDITAGKTAQIALRESEAFLRLCQEVGGIGSWEADLVSNKQKWSENYFSLFGFSENKNPTWADFLEAVHPDDRQRVIDATQAHLDHGTIYDVEYRIIIDNEVIRWMRSAGQAERDTNGKPVKMRGIGQDITARKQFEIDLTRTRDNMRAILDNSPYMVWLKDTQGCYIEVNEVFANYTYLKTPAQVIGKTDFDLWPAELAEKFRADDAEIMAARQKQRRIEEQSFDGTGIHWVETFKTAIVDDNGRVTGTSGFTRDISERKKTEQELLQTSTQLRELLVKYELLQEAERKAIAREVHDELGQLLSALRLDISMIRTRFAKDNPALIELVKDATELADRALHGVRDVTEHLRPTILGMGIHASLQWLCDNFTLRTGIACALSPDPCVELDEMSSTGLFRIVQESLTNVMRHAGEVHKVTISMALTNGELCISVKDDGRGFNLENSKLLTSFGVLGMRERALALGGNLDIVSAPGKSTVVSVCIPVSDRAYKQ